VTLTEYGSGVRYRSILVPIDDSLHAQVALAHAAGLARRDGARLTLIHAIAPRDPVCLPGHYVIPRQLPETEEKAEELLQEAAATVPADFSVSTVIRRGPPAWEILRRVEAAEHDLVVMGSRGRGPARALLLGSVSRVVGKRCPVPVITIHAKSSRRKGAASRPAGERTTRPATTS